MVLAFKTILASSRRAAREAREHPIEAVHEYRKSIRRARAIVELLRPALGQRASDGLVVRLRTAFSRTGGLRDTDILLAVLAPFDPNDAGVETLRNVLESEFADRPDPAQTAKLLEDGALDLRPLTQVLDVILPVDYSIGELQEGLARSQRRARQTLSRAIRWYSEENFHRWRRRIKELRYQVELLASGGSRPLRDREAELGRLARDVGGVTDFFVLGREIEGRSATLPGAAELLRKVRDRSEAAARRMLERGAGLLSEPPRRFAARALAERG